jgi:hypothetical protein
VCLNEFGFVCLVLVSFKALVRPKLENCNTIWDPHTQQQTLQIEQIQRRAARYVSNRYHNTSSVTDIMSDLNWDFGRTKALNACSLMAGECTFTFLLMNPSD